MKVVWTTDAQGSLVTASPGAEKIADAAGAVEGEEEQFDQNLNHKQGSWWDWASSKLDQAKEWVGGVFHNGDKDGSSEKSVRGGR